MLLALRGMNWASSGAIYVYNPDEEMPNGTSNLAYSPAADPYGLTTSLVVIPSEDNQIAVTNTGSAPVDVLLSAQGWFSIPQSPELDEPAPVTEGDIVVEGTLTRDGAPVEGGAVTATIWPDQDAFAAFEEDEEIDVHTLEQAKTDEEGRFRIVTSTSDLAPEYVDDQGQVQVEVAAEDETSLMEYNLTVRPQATASAPRSLGAESATESQDITMDLGSGAAFDESNNPEADWLEESGEGPPEAAQAVSTTEVMSKADEDGALMSRNLSAVSGTATTRVGVGPICRIKNGAMIYGNQERFLSVYNWSGAKATLVQSGGSEHTLGIGVQYAAKGTGWSASGSKTLSAEAVGTMTGVVNRTVSHKVNYRKVHRVCATKVVSTTVVPHSFHSFFTRFEPVEQKNWRKACQPYTRLDFRKSKGKAYTKVGGVDLGFVTLNASSGYNNQSAYTFHIRQKSMLCANDAIGPVLARGVQVRKYGY